MSDPQSPQQTRRELLKKAAYVAPAIMSLPVTPALSQAGSSAVSPRSVGLQAGTSRRGGAASLRGFARGSRINLFRLRIRKLGKWF
jgi:hypothetical protein